MAFTLVIAGRPNVGKSTLFNRLTGRKLALVDPTPGLTRDRREGTAQLGHERIRVIDTAGLEEGDPGSIPARMREQTLTGVAEADLVLFVMDARAGLVPADEVFASMVRQSGKPVIVVANKCEGRVGMDGAYEAFALGLGDPVAISAEHSDGVGALIADILGEVEKWKQAQTDIEASDYDPKTGQHPLKVAIVGRPNAGKSTLVNALLGEDRMITGPEAGLTRDTIASDLVWPMPKGLQVPKAREGDEPAIAADIEAPDIKPGPRDAKFDDDFEIDPELVDALDEDENAPINTPPPPVERRIKLFDTAGLRRKARIQQKPEQLAVGDALRAVRFAEVVVLLLDAERPFDRQDLTIADLAHREGRGLVIAVNKWDLIRDKPAAFKKLRQEAERLLPQVRGVPIITLSAIRGAGLDRLRDAILEAEEVWNRRVSTGRLNRFLGAAIERHPPPAVGGRRIRMRFMTQPNARPPTFIVFASRPDELPASYTRYLINGLRETFSLPGVPIRLHLRKGKNPYMDGKKGR